jgi:HAD superfamily hydrolase (TIGR01484 family)
MRILICTDLDRTLLPNGNAPESPEARPRFRRLAARPEVSLAYVTGRHRELVLDAMGEYGIPIPDYVIGDVGSTIYRVSDGQWTASDAWSAQIAPDWGRRDRSALAALLAGIRGLTLQEPAKQGRHKLSYYTPPDWDQRCLIPEMDDLLTRHRVRANLIWSLDERTGTGLLDVLPASASKRHAIEFLLAQEGFGPGETVFSGDSGNDLAVLVSPIQATLVANATEEVRAQALADARHDGTSDSLYLARGGFQGMNGNYAAGILEGVAHYLPAVAEWWD